MDWQTVFLTIGGSVIAFIGAWCYHIMVSLSAHTAKLWEAIAMDRQSFADYKLEVSKDFASVAHLKDVESRMVTALEGISDKLDKLIDAFHQHQIEERNK